MDICKWWICYRLQLISILQSNFSEKWYIQENVWFSQIFQKIIPIFEKTSRILCSFRKRRNRFNTILIRKMWIEEWLLYFSFAYGRIHRRLKDFASTFNIRLKTIPKIIKKKLKIILDCRNRWPLYVNVDT